MLFKCFVGFLHCSDGSPIHHHLASYRKQLLYPQTWACVHTLSFSPGVMWGTRPVFFQSAWFSGIRQLTSHLPLPNLTNAFCRSFVHLWTSQQRDWTCRSVTSRVSHVAKAINPSERYRAPFNTCLFETMNQRKREWDLHDVLLRIAAQARNRVGLERLEVRLDGRLAWRPPKPTSQ